MKNMLRTPPSSVGPSKRKLEDEFKDDEQSNDKVDSGVNKKLNMSERSDSDPNNLINNSTRQFGNQNRPCSNHLK